MIFSGYLTSVKGIFFSLEILVNRPSFAFSGNFNGNGYKVSKLTIVSQADYSDYLGLFGLIDEGGQVNSLGVDRCLIQGSSSTPAGRISPFKSRYR